MRSCFVLSFAVVVATIAIAPPLRAQDQRALHLYGGVGLEMFYIRDGSDFTPGPVLQLGVVRQVAGSRLGARFDATYFRSYGGSTMLGATVGLTSDVGSGGWRPYVLGSVGIYRLSWARLNAGALIGGLGLRRAIGSRQVFGELRYLYMTNGTGFWQHRLPLTFGIRF